jgi:urease accessory protein|tara:strand:- start:4229 stop:4735 length:507 start_codon:yes stop_codon:yes gene_type:complete
MLVINSILGNAYHGKNIESKIQTAKENNTLKRLFLTRIQMEKSHLRTETEDGIELGLSLEPGTVLHNGDVLEVNSNLVIIHQLPEKIIRVNFVENDWSPSLLIQLGHIIGNRHRPISIPNNSSVLFPIHDDTEVELFENLFHEIIHHITLNVEDEIFVPNQGMNVHEH